MSEIFRLSVLAVFLFFFGIFDSPAYAQQETGLPSCTKEQSAKDAGQLIHYKKYKSDKFDGQGKGKPPIGTQTMNSLGEKGLKLSSIDVETDSYVYWFLCKEQFDYQVLSLKGSAEEVLARLNQLTRSLKWGLVATPRAHGEQWYYLAKPTQPAR